MILEGNACGYGAELAHHLLNPRDNDHVTVHGVEGFVADDLLGAFAEAEAIAQATQCQKYLFSLSLNPPMDASVPVEAFEDAIAAVERKLGLAGQPRAIVFHEKNGRRHAHCVWSRIDASKLKAINLSHYKRKLGDISRDLYRTHAWEMPDGFRDAARRDPDSYSRDEAGQAKRLNRDPKALKVLFRRCWEGSDSRAAFAAALKEHGFLLARGDRRGFVAVDAEGKTWSLSRWCGVKPREMRKRLGPEDALPSVEEVLAQARDLPPPKTERPNPAAEQRRAALVARQRSERADLLKAQDARRIAELKDRQARLPKGLKAVFLRATGQYQLYVRGFEAEAHTARQRDAQEQHTLVERHLAERRALIRELRRDGVAEAFRGVAARDPRQSLHLPPDNLALTRDQLMRDPARILDHLSQTKARFERADILRALARRIDDPFALRDAADKALKSPELIRLDGDTAGWFTTRDFRAAEDRLRTATAQMAATGGCGVNTGNAAKAMGAQDAKMRRAFGGKLSGEQRKAIRHILGEGQFACVVGLAGAGKSTMLAAAQDAWVRQGITVHGAALAGKAADGLESASRIASRTLASLETSWENGYAPIARGDVLVVDEAGMIGTRQLARVAAKMREIGAKLVLVGDPDQLQPIEAGTPFRDLVETHGAAHLTEIHRQRADWQQQASRDLAAGRIDDAVQRYADRNAVTRGEDRDAAIEALVEAYSMDALANGPAATRLAFAHKRRDVHALNQAIRATLHAERDSPSEVLLDTETGPRAFGPGDRIVFGRNDTALGVRNGMLGTVQSVSETELRVTLDGDPARTITIDPRRYRHIDHGYAVTIHKSQGATVDQAYVLASRSMDHHLAYVAMTRHRAAMRLFIDNRDRPIWAMDQQLQRKPQRAQSRAGPTMG